MTNEAELLPCPAGHTGAFAGITLDDGCYVMCAKNDCFWMYAYTQTNAEAIAGWNTRTPSTPEASEQTEALRGEVERLRKLVKANNDLARHEAQARIALQAENAKLKDALDAILEASHVGKAGQIVSFRSKYANYPAMLYHAARATLSRAEEDGK